MTYARWMQSDVPRRAPALARSQHLTKTCCPPWQRLVLRTVFGEARDQAVARAVVGEALSHIERSRPPPVLCLFIAPPRKVFSRRYMACRVSVRAIAP